MRWKGLMMAVALLLLGSVFAAPQLSAHAQSRATDLDTSNCVYDGDRAPRLFGGARAASLVTSATPLLSQPPLSDDTRPLTVIDLPAGAAVIVTDLDEQSRSYFRVIWPCDGQNFTGWVRADDVRRQRNRVNARFAPPGCARPVDWVNLINDSWISSITGDIAVVVDLYRNQGGTQYPRSFYYLTVNGQQRRDRDRPIQTTGPFLITGVVMGLNVRAGQAIGFEVTPPAREPVNFFGIIYQVPEGCQFVE